MRNALTYIISAFLLLPFCAAGQITLPDTIFRNCLKNRYPAVLTPALKLDTVKAAQIPALVCTNLKINNAEGIQYFKGLTTMDLSVNNLYTLPDLSGLVKLQILEIHENKIGAITGLNRLRRLKEIYAQVNYLNRLPDLSMNDSLITLYVHTNFLDTLPDLRNLKQLRLLNVVNNKLRYLPYIESLTSLQSIICWGNQIVSLPDLSKHLNLKRLDAALNQLSQVPPLPANKNMIEIFFNNNKLSVLPDLSGYNSLSLLKVMNNQLTFKELTNILNIPGYTEKVRYSPQANLLVRKILTFYDKEPAVLETGIDKGVNGVIYEWYKNGIFQKAAVSDTFRFSSVQLTDSGKYTCSIRHPSFPGLTLQTDTFYVSVLPCLNLSKLNISTTGINCWKLGEIKISGALPSQTSLTYTLKNPLSGKTVSSGTGIFTGLTGSAYNLTIQTKFNCEKTYAETITIPVEPCKEAYITPNNDGDSDSIYFPQSGKVIIYDKKGSIIKTLILPSDWDGTAKEGRVAQGYYTADINNGEEVINISVMY